MTARKDTARRPLQAATLWIVVCTVTRTASTVSAGLYGGLPKPLAGENQHMRALYYTVDTISFPTDNTLTEGNVGLIKRSCNGP